jgi:hypothetical protein
MQRDGHGADGETICGARRLVNIPGLRRAD